jgi:hypothetical protein
MLGAFRIPLTWSDLLKRTFAEAQADNCLGLAAQLSYYFFLAQRMATVRCCDAPEKVRMGLFEPGRVPVE